MFATDDLIPRPPVIRERLALTVREAARLRRLLRISESAAEDRRQQAQLAAQASQGEGGGR